jgi:hypothetical protein
VAWGGAVEPPAVAVRVARPVAHASESPDYRGTPAQDLAERLLCVLRRCKRKLLRDFAI